MLCILACAQAKINFTEFNTSLGPAHEIMVLILKSLTLCILMDYSFWFDIVFFCLKIIFTFTNSADPNEMLHNAAFLLGLHCL